MEGVREVETEGVATTLSIGATHRRRGEVLISMRIQASDSVGDLLDAQICFADFMPFKHPCDNNISRWEADELSTRLENRR